MKMYYKRENNGTREKMEAQRRKSKKDQIPLIILLFGLVDYFVSGPTPGVHTHPSAKTDLKVKASGRSKSHYGLELSSDFWLQGAFLHVCAVSLALKENRAAEIS